MTIGIIGKIASGKTTLAKAIQKNPRKYNLPQKDFFVLEIDTLGHRLLENKEIQQELRDIFGEEIVGAIPCNSPRIDRNLLRKKALSSPAKLKKLEAILHPKMKDLLEEKIKESVFAKATPDKENMIIVCALPKTFLLNTFCTQIKELEIDKKTAWERAKKRNPLLKESEFEVIWERQEEEYS